MHDLPRHTAEGEGEYGVGVADDVQRVHPSLPRIMIEMIRP